uniref:non-specific serine/threonine protein kinase n=1 Tax=Helianthus annuus TaxID=4232 RepID=A0A251UI14_HELAN
MNSLSRFCQFKILCYFYCIGGSLEVCERQQEVMELPLFSFSIVAQSTANFSSDNKLGEGGFGPVYKGVLEGKEIAVKRLSTTSRQGLNEFKNEVICISKLQHRNLVKLLGCSIEGDEKLLIYEYMPNRSLDLFIFRPEPTWTKRLHIIKGIARGLLYLHQDSRLRIIHRDLKASNILLDLDMNPKISDFGIARSFGGNETQANTERVVGTYGYMSPKYALDGLFVGHPKHHHHMHKNMHLQKKVFLDLQT